MRSVCSAVFYGVCCPALNEIHLLIKNSIRPTLEELISFSFSLSPFFLSNCIIEVSSNWHKHKYLMRPGKPFIHPKLSRLPACLPLLSRLASWMTAKRGTNPTKIKHLKNFIICLVIKRTQSGLSRSWAGAEEEHESWQTPTRLWSIRGARGRGRGNWKPNAAETISVTRKFSWRQRAAVASLFLDMLPSGSHWLRSWLLDLA